MNDQEQEDNKFTWNDLVRIKFDVPKKFKPGEIVAVCGLEKVQSEKLSKTYHVEKGSWLYTVEFGDGSSIEVPECYLEPYHE